MARASVSRLGLGAANLGNLYAPMSDEAAEAVLQTAWDCGVRAFDTAPHYGLGLSERRLGEFLRTHARESYTVTTKVGRLLRPDPAWSGGDDTAHDFVVPARLRRVWDASADGLRRSLEESLERLGLERVDAVYLHDPERHDLRAGLEEGLAGLVALREQGLVAEVGVASMDAGALAAFARTGALDRLMVAGRHTLADQSAATEVLPLCRDHGVDVVAAAVFNSGVLASPDPGVTDRYDYGPVPADVLARTRRIAEVCAGYGVPLAVAAMRYPLLDPTVVAVVAGAATPDQVRANARALETDVSDDLWCELRAEGLVR